MSEDHYQLLPISLRSEDPSSFHVKESTRRPEFAALKSPPRHRFISHVENSQVVRPYKLLAPTDSNQETPEASTNLVNPPLTEQSWRTGYFQNTPWLGIGSLLLALCSTIASGIVLVMSNEAAVSSWNVSPSVVLAVLSAISTASLHVALPRGLNISWWYRMLSGAPLADAHRYWDYGNNLWPAITAGRQFNFLSAATIFVALAAIEGPLIQKASTISTRQVSRPISLQAGLAVNLPSGYTADVTGQFRSPTTPSVHFSEAFNNYTSRTTINSGFDGCPGLCTANVAGVGFKVSCAPDTITTWNLSSYWDTRRQTQFTARTYWRAVDDFGNLFISSGGSNEYLTVTAGWAINTGTPFTYVNRVCNLSLAMVSYPLQIANNVTKLVLPVGSNPEVLIDLPIARTPISIGLTGPTTLGGFYLLGNSQFSADVTMFANGALALYALEGLNSFAWSHAINLNWDVMQFGGHVWRDPIDDILAAYHEIIFRLALTAATDETLIAPIVLDGISYTSVRNVSGTYIFDENYYISKYEFLGGAMAVILLAVCSVTLTFRGWWKIGRPTTLSPLETAKAFKAPLLSECHSNSVVEDLLQSVQHKKVQYGSAKLSEIWNNERALQLAEDGTVSTPKSGTMFQK